MSTVESKTQYAAPDATGHFGPYGGAFVPEILVPVLEELKAAYNDAQADPEFDRQYRHLLREYVGRPTPLSFADRLAVMRGGQIDQVGTPEDVYYRPRTLFVAQFLGRTNLLLSQAAGTEADTPLGRVGLNREASGTVLVSMRPEHLALETTETSNGARATVVGRSFKGHDITYRVCCHGNEYLVHTDNRHLYEPGDTVAVRPLEPAVVLESRSTPAEVPSGATPEPESEE